LAKAYAGRLNSNAQSSEEEENTSDDEKIKSPSLLKKARKNIFVKYRTDMNPEDADEIGDQEAVGNPSNAEQAQASTRKRKYIPLVSPMRNKVTAVIEPSASISSEPCDEGRTGVLFR